jgi:hypothetical protein
MPTLSTKPLSPQKKAAVASQHKDSPDQTTTTDDIMPRMQGTSIAESDVLDYLQKHYPLSDLGWVRRCLWSQDNLLLDDIAWEDRPGGIDKTKVTKKAKEINEGDQPHPIVVVAPDAESPMFVADGYHRCAALAKTDHDSVSAWVGVLKPGNVGWKADIEQMQFTSRNTAPSPK